MLSNTPKAVPSPRLVTLVQISALWRISSVNLFATSLHSLSLPLSIFFEITVDALNSGNLGDRLIDNISQLILRRLAVEVVVDSTGFCVQPVERCYRLFVCETLPLPECFEGVGEFVELLVHGDSMGSEPERSLMYL
jgi:hypothetical protein